MGVDVITQGRQRARAGPWRGDPDVAYLAPAPNAPVPSPEFVRHCLDDLARRGFRAVVTSALAGAESSAFLAAGFDVHERLHVLEYDLKDLAAGAPEVPLRRALRRDRPAVLALDRRAFPPFWRLDDAGLDDAIGATPASRFRVAGGPDAVVGYAVSGRAGRQGYLQRLAVEPHQQRRGTGRALVLDGLRWMRRWGAEKAVVNTQQGNQPALELYLALGFHLQPLGLSVLRYGTLV